MRFLLFTILIVPTTAFGQVDKSQNDQGINHSTIIGIRCTAEPVVNPPLFEINGYVVKPSIVGSKLNPADIESIEVTKGTEAIVTYGEKAKFGVIRIMVKQKAFKILIDDGVIKPIL